MLILQLQNCYSYRMLKNLRRIFVSSAVLLSSVLFFSCTKPGDSSVQQAVTAYGAGKYDQALELFNEALEKQTRYSDELIFAFISNIYAAQEDFENAAIWMEKSLEKKPDYRNYVTLGMDWQTLKNYQKAEEAYKNAIQMNEQKGEGWASLGMLYLEEGKSLEKSIESLKKGAEFAPKIAVIHAYLGVAYLKNGQKDLAEQEFALAQELKCENLEQIKEKFLK